MTSEIEDKPVSVEAAAEAETKGQEIASSPLVPVPSAPFPALKDHAPRRRWLRTLILVLLVAIGGGGGFAYWWHMRQAALPAGIAFGNGRIEAEEIDIDTKFAGRLAERLVDEGDLVSAGQVVARMDTRDLEASLAKSQSQVEQAQRSYDEAEANVVQSQTLLTLARQEYDRTVALVQRGYATRELLDQRRQSLEGATAALTAAKARVEEAARARDAATHDVDLYKVNIADNTLVSPTVGRIQYRIANVGEVLAAGGKVLTLLDISDVYMDVYLPTLDAGRIRIGSEARIVLDAYPKLAIPCHVSFVATQAQFTPKAVETQTERDKLMFRVKVKVDKDVLQAHAANVRTGLPGRAFVKTDPKVEWPQALREPAR